jgi:tripartite-type tricarboxylate transporter receptor subunit TctC
MSHENPWDYLRATFGGGRDMMNRLFSAITVALFFIVAGTGAKSQAAEQPHYKGKSLRLLVPFAPGGGTDIRARFIAEHIRRYIPGNPRTLVENRPGGGGAIAFNYLSTRAKRDGTEVMVSSGGVPIRWITQQEGHEYDLREMPIVATFPYGAVLFVRTGAATDAGSFLQSKALRAAHTVGQSSYLVLELVVNDVLGVDWKPVTGYGSYGEAKLAVLRGEAEYSWVSSLDPGIETHVKAGEIALIYQTGIVKGDELMVDPRFPEGVPVLTSFFREAKGKDLPDDPVWPAVRTAIASLALSGSVWLPPGTPQHVYDVLAKAFQDMVNSPKYQKAALEFQGADDIAFVGKDAQAVFDSFENIEPESIMRLI